MKLPSPVSSRRWPGASPCFRPPAGRARQERQGQPPGDRALSAECLPREVVDRHSGLVAFRERATVGARGQQIVGEVLAALATPEGRADPYPLYERLRTIGPAATAPDGTMVVTGYRECSMLLRDHRLHKAPERRLADAGYPRWQDRPALRLMFGSIMMLNLLRMLDH